MCPRTFIALFWILWPFGICAQAIYNGHVQDVATRRAVDVVEVKLLHSDKEVHSNYGGDFVIKNTEQDSLSYAEDSYRFFHNALIWEGKADHTFEFFSLDGKLLSPTVTVRAQGSFLLPHMPVGIYFLRVASEGGMAVFRAFSDGDKTTSVHRQTTWHRSSVATRADTLELTKAGYYTRRVALHGSDTTFTVNLLKKEQQGELHYFNELVAPVAFELIASLPSRSNESEVSSVKILHDWNTDLMYYTNTKKYEYHHSFARDQLGFDQGNMAFNFTQYRNNADRYLYCSNLNYFHRLDKYVLHFVSANEIDCAQIRRIYDKIIETSYLKGKLYLLVNRPYFQDCGLPTITTEELYNSQNYQALNLAQNFGYLKKVDLQDLEQTFLGRQDIALLNGIPNDVSVVAGIITTEFQTPLSHINVLSHNRGTPNMALRDGWENEQLQSLLGELVYLQVRSDSFSIRRAELEEARAFWDQNAPQEIVDLPMNTEINELVNLEEADHSFLDEIGGKAANFAELLKVRSFLEPVPTPEQPFAIPFHFYQQHLQQSGLDSFIEQMLSSSDFLNSPVIRKLTLEELQRKIIDFPLDPDLVQAVEEKIDYFGNFSSFRFRSSTNAEDLESFSGAGLYSSYSAKKYDPTKTVDLAIKRVWASLWNWRAFEERSYYKIKHNSCAMGILVHRSFPNEDANGVLITKNLYNSNRGFTINAQYGEHSIVFPEPGILHDLIILFTFSIIPGQSFMPEYLTFSNIPELNGNTVLSDAELIKLGEYSKAIQRHFYNEVPHNCDCSLDNFGLDIEFKVDSQLFPRQIYIKQVRVF